jgi:uncharacterized LabA/DUF88 family protein
MTRAVFFVDGFNLYHSLLTHPRAAACKWLDVRGLCAGFLQKTETLHRVTYFTALATWNRKKAERHQEFLRAQRHHGVEIVQGEFKWKDRRCRNCNSVMKVPEEKMTDVSIAVRLLGDAHRDEFDLAFLMSGDTDLIPAIRALRDLHPDKEIVAVFPYNRVTEALKLEVHRYMRTRLDRLERHRLPETIALPTGKPITCPVEWRATQS